MVLIDTLEFVGRERPDLLDAIEELRFKIWAGPFLDSICNGLSVDSVDLEAFHVVCFCAGQPVGAGRVSFHQRSSSIPDQENFAPWIVEADFPAAFLNRLVVDPAYRKRGVAQRIDKARLGYAQCQGTINALFAEATGARIDALKALGFAILGESPDRRYPGRWHIMRKKSPRFSPSNPLKREIII